MIKPPESLLGDNQVRGLCELAAGTPPGCIVEVGVYRGGTAFHLEKVAGEQHRELHLFDTFCGIPFQEGDDFHAVGDFSDTSADVVQRAIPNAILHVGVFPGTMPANLGPVAFVHIDADQYRSIKDAIDTLWPLMVPGGIMAFDDYGTTHIPGATRAVDDSFPADALKKGQHVPCFVTKER